MLQGGREGRGWKVVDITYVAKLQLCGIDDLAAKCLFVTRFLSTASFIPGGQELFCELKFASCSEQRRYQGAGLLKKYWEALLCWHYLWQTWNGLKTHTMAVWDFMPGTSKL